jgi:hypothetical protein
MMVVVTTMATITSLASLITNTLTNSDRLYRIRVSRLEVTREGGGGGGGQGGFIVMTRGMEEQLGAVEMSHPGI